MKFSNFIYQHQFRFISIKMIIRTHTDFSSTEIFCEGIYILPWACIKKTIEETKKAKEYILAYKGCIIQRFFPAFLRPGCRYRC